MKTDLHQGTANLPAADLRTALARPQSILLFRELEFPLRTIRRILDDPSFDQTAALADQIKLLARRQEQLGRLISLARETLKTEVAPMKFNAQAIGTYDVSRVFL